ncbi:protein of unknown function [Stenotrophomonas maltophilia]|nr:protein of unknown function [Stenotrophomonas maltophilia]
MREVRAFASTRAPCRRASLTLLHIANRENILLFVAHKLSDYVSDNLICMPLQRLPCQKIQHQMQFVDCDRIGMLPAVERDDGAPVCVGLWHAKMFP